MSSGDEEKSSMRYVRPAASVAAAIAIGSSANAGSLAAPLVESDVVLAEEAVMAEETIVAGAASSGSFVIPLLLLALIAAAASSSSGGTGLPEE